MSAVAVESVLARALEREWTAQSGCNGPLLITPAVREAVELLTRCAIDVAAALRDDAPTPAALVDRIRQHLPETPDPWALRMLPRVSAVAPVAAPLALPSPEPSGPLVIREAPPGPAMTPAPRRSRWAGIRAALRLNPRTRPAP